MNGIKGHVCTNQGRRFQGHGLTEPPQDARVGNELPDNHGMWNRIVRETFNPLGFDESQFGSKVRADESELRGREHGDTESGHGHGDADQIAGQGNEWQQTTAQMIEGNRLVEFGIAHQIPKGNGFVAKGKGRHVHHVMTEGREEEEWKWSHGVRDTNVDDIVPPHVFDTERIGPSRDPNPPRQDKFVHTGRFERAQKVTTRPRVVGLIAIGDKGTVPVPAFGVNDVMEFNNRTTFVIRDTWSVINPMKFAIVIKTETIVHVEGAVHGIVLEIEFGADHLVGSDTD
mmetsp:Transcript_21369/g.35351  ORF Transcript_21369/g.35351 Transcript_21369/m.35351 type:complete len:286 (+) Transcript_21369:104-961(+)